MTRESYNYSYVCEKFAVALDALTREGPLRDRLRNAYVSALIRLQEDDFPEHMRADFREFRETLTRKNIGTITMSDQEVAELSKRVLWLFFTFVTSARQE